MTRHDRDLGMGAPITRRDFLNGVAVGIGGALAAGRSSTASTRSSRRALAARTRRR